MHHTDGMHGGQPLCQRDGQAPNLAFGQRTPRLHALVQRRTLDVLQRKVGRIGVDVGDQHPGGVRTLNPGEQLSLAGELGPEGRVAHQTGLQHLDRGSTPVASRPA